MELAGAQRCFQYLQEKGIKASTFISDRHKGIAKWIRDHMKQQTPNTTMTFGILLKV